MTAKKTAGLSYVEVLMAFALFVIVLAAVFPIISQANRNMEYAVSGHLAHRTAENIMWAVRDALVSDGDPLAAAKTAGEGFIYSFWVNNELLHSDDAPDGKSTINVVSEENIVASTIAVVVWNEHGYIAGRAVGVVFGVVFPFGIKKSKTRGGAYITVLVVTMFVFLVLSIALATTATSRNLTARYRDFSSLYDIAAAGNEKALVLLNNKIDANREEILSQIEHLEEYGQRAAFIYEAMPHLEMEINPISWHMDVNFTPENGPPVKYRYVASTHVAKHGNAFVVHTTVHTCLDGEVLHTTVHT